MSRGAETREAIFAQPDWLRGVPARVGSRRLPQGRVVFAGCGTSFHAAQTGGEAVQALDLVHERLERADVFVLVSHEGQTPLTLEVAKSYPEVEKWLVTGAVESPLAEFCDEVVVATPTLERSWCHTASYTCAVAAIAALRGEDVNWLPPTWSSADPKGRRGSK